MAFLTVCYYSKGRQNVHFKHQACRVYDCLSGIFTERTAKHCTVLTNAPSFILFSSLFIFSNQGGQILSALFKMLGAICISEKTDMCQAHDFLTFVTQTSQIRP